MTTDDYPLHGVWEGAEIGIEAWPIEVAVDADCEVMCMVTVYETRKKRKTKFKTLLTAIINN